jgi:hypothetical protein
MPLPRDKAPRIPPEGLLLTGQPSRDCHLFRASRKEGRALVTGREFKKSINDDERGEWRNV